MKRKMKLSRASAWWMIPLAVITAVILVECVVQLPVLGLPAADRRLVEYDLSQAVMTRGGAEDDAAAPSVDMEASEGFEEADESEAMKEALAADDVDSTETVSAPWTFTGQHDALFLPYDGYAGRVTVYLSGTDGLLTWRMHDRDGNVTALVGDVGPYPQDTAVLNGWITGLTLQLDAAPPIHIDRITLDQRFNWNPYRMLLTGLVTLAVCLLIHFRKAIGREPAYGFVLLSLALGIFLSIAFYPHGWVGWDDQIHLARVRSLSYGLPGKITTHEEYLQLPYFRQRFDTWEDGMAARAYLDQVFAEETVLGNANRSWSFSDVGYVTQSFGMGIARMMGLPFSWIMAAGRLMQSLTYTLLCFLAIRMLRQYKLIFAAVALLPTPIFLSGNFSYDPTVLGCMLLGSALLLNAMLPGAKPIHRWQALGIWLLMLVGGMIKVVYMPLLLLAWLIPQKHFANPKESRWFKAASTILCIAGILAMVLAVRAGQAVLEDDRGYGNTAEQIRFLLHQPLLFGQYLVSFLVREFSTYLSPHTQNELGMIVHVPATMLTLSFGITLFAAVAGRREADTSLSLPQKSGMVLIALAAAALTAVIMYLAFSPVASPAFMGLQARYFLPLMPFLYVLLAPRQVVCRMKQERVTLGFYLIQGLILTVTFGTYFLKLYQ